MKKRQNSTTIRFFTITCVLISTICLTTQKSKGQTMMHQLRMTGQQLSKVLGARPFLPGIKFEVKVDASNFPGNITLVAFGIENAPGLTHYKDQYVDTLEILDATVEFPSEFKIGTLEISKRYTKRERTPPGNPPYPPLPPHSRRINSLESILGGPNLTLLPTVTEVIFIPTLYYPTNQLIYELHFYDNQGNELHAKDSKGRLFAPIGDPTILNPSPPATAF